MKLLRRLWQEEDGQGLVEYTLVMMVVALVFWVAVKETNLGVYLVKVWGRVSECMATPEICKA